MSIECSVSIPAIHGSVKSCEYLVSNSKIGILRELAHSITCLLKVCPYMPTDGNNGKFFLRVLTSKNYTKDGIICVSLYCCNTIGVFVHATDWLKRMLESQKEDCSDSDSNWLWSSAGNPCCMLNSITNSNSTPRYIQISLEENNRVKNILENTIDRALGNSLLVEWIPSSHYLFGADRNTIAKGMDFYLKEQTLQTSYTHCCSVCRSVALKCPHYQLHVPHTISDCRMDVPDARIDTSTMKISPPDFGGKIHCAIQKMEYDTPPETYFRKMIEGIDIRTCMIEESVLARAFAEWVKTNKDKKSKKSMKCNLGKFNLRKLPREGVLWWKQTINKSVKKINLSTWEVTDTKKKLFHYKKSDVAVLQQQRGAIANIVEKEESRR